MTTQAPRAVARITEALDEYARPYWTLAVPGFEPADFTELGVALALARHHGAAYTLILGEPR